LREKAASLYDEALSLYKKQRYQEALKRFRQVQRLISDYGRTERYISRLQDIMESERKRAEEETKEERLATKAASLYDEALSLYQRGRYRDALEKFKETQRLIPDYERTAYYISRVQEDIQRERRRLAEAKEVELKEAEAEELELREKAASLYDEALSLYKKQRYQEAL
ncbi:MAG: hypothetical protein JSW40_04870, partial [Candidatus Omnitrophota bacterium]